MAALEVLGNGPLPLFIGAMTLSGFVPCAWYVKEDGLDSGIGGGQFRIFGCNLVDDPGFCAGTANAWTPIGSLLGFLGIGSLLTSEVSREGEIASVITGRRIF